MGLEELEQLRLLLMTIFGGITSIIYAWKGKQPK